VAAAGWANSAAVAVAVVTARGTNVTSTPAAAVDAANTRASRSRRGLRSPASTPSARWPAGGRPPGRPGTETRASKAAAAVTANTGPYPQRSAAQHPSWQAHQRGHAGHDAVQAQPFAPPLGRDQQCGQRAGRHRGDREADPAGDVHHDHHGKAHRPQQGQRGRAQQQQPGGQRQPVPGPGHHPRGGQLARHAGHQQRAGGQPAPAPEPDADFTYSGTTDSGRKKLVSAPMTDTNRTSSGRVTSGGNAAAAGPPAAGLACPSWVADMLFLQSRN
jgi:hypothetical protein